jgi:hypothetical protein
VESLKDFETPAPPQTIIKRPDEDDTLLSPDQQTKFRSGTGMLLYLVNDSRFDISKSIKNCQKWQMERPQHTGNFFYATSSMQLQQNTWH